MLDHMALCNSLMLNLGHSQTVSWSEGRFRRRPSTKASVERSSVEISPVQRGCKCRTPKKATNNFCKQALIYFNKFTEGKGEINPKN